MAKRRRKRIGPIRTAVRLPDEAAEHVDELVERTGWSPAKAIGFLTRLGGHQLRGQTEAVESLRKFLEASIEQQKLATLQEAARDLPPGPRRKVMAAVREAKTPAEGS